MSRTRARAPNAPRGRHVCVYFYFLLNGKHLQKLAKRSFEKGKKKSRNNGICYSLSLQIVLIVLLSCYGKKKSWKKGFETEGKLSLIISSLRF